jgi:ribonuclease P protein component
MIPFKNRFHGHSSLKYVYKNGLAVRSRLMTMKSINNPHRPESRIAVVVGKKVIKSAVSRNRIRRRTYEYLRQQQDLLKPSTDLVIIVSSSEVLTIPHEELAECIEQLLIQSDLYKTPKS